MKELNIGLAIKELAKEKKISVEDISKALSIDRQSVYGTFKRTNISTNTIQKYATAIGVSSDDILVRAGIKSNTLQNSNDDIFAKGDGYLMKYIAELEERVREQGNTMREQSLIMKDQSKTISVLLGKSKGVIDGLVFAENPFFGAFSERYGYTPTK